MQRPETDSMVPSEGLWAPAPLIIHTSTSSFLLPPLCCLPPSPSLIISWWRRLWSRRGIWSRGSPRNTRCFWPSGIGRWRRARWAPPGWCWRNSGCSSACETTNIKNEANRLRNDSNFRCCQAEHVTSMRAYSDTHITSVSPGFFIKRCKTGHFQFPPPPFWFLKNFCTLNYLHDLR